MSIPSKKTEDPPGWLRLLNQETKLGQVLIKSFIRTEHEPRAQETTIKVSKIKVRKDQIERELDGEVWLTCAEAKRPDAEL